MKLLFTICNLNGFQHLTLKLKEQNTHPEDTGYWDTHWETLSWAAKLKRQQKVLVYLSLSFVNLCWSNKVCWKAKGSSLVVVVRPRLHRTLPQWRPTWDSTQPETQTWIRSVCLPHFSEAGSVLGMVYIVCIRLGCRISSGSQSASCSGLHRQVLSPRLLLFWVLRRPQQAPGSWSFVSGEANASGPCSWSFDT